MESGLENKVKADKYFDPNKLEWKLQVAIQQLPENNALCLVYATMMSYLMKK